jgi:hypothetical protein
VNNPRNPCILAFIYIIGRKTTIVCINVSMNDYVYQIKGALESPIGEFKGFQVLVCDLNNFEVVNVPAEILNNETAKYIQFRLKVSSDALEIQKLPYSVQSNIRAPLGRWLDRWVLNNFYGDISNRKSTNA